jgi:hypothetical protein
MPKPGVVNDRMLELIQEILDGSSRKLARYHPKVAKALQHMADHLKDKIGLQELAAHACTSRILPVVSRGGGPESHAVSGTVAGGTGQADPGRPAVQRE